MVSHGLFLSTFVAKCKNKRLLGKLNMFFPLLLGCLIYLVFRQDAYIQNATDLIPPIRFLREWLLVEYYPKSVLGKFFFYNFTDFLWAYSLEWSVLLATKKKSCNTIICAIYCSLTETVQLWMPDISTFDVWDIVSQLLGVFCASAVYYCIFCRYDGA